MDRARTIFLGSGRFGIPILRRLAEHPAVALVGVITAPPRPAGRRGELASTPIAQATPPDTTLLTPARVRAPQALADVAALQPDLAVLADYGQLVPARILDLPAGALNLHPSLLPRHRGATPIPAAILAGDEETGVTLFRMDAGLDTGPIVAQRRAVLGDDDTAALLHARLSVMAADLLADTLERWIAGSIPAVPQPERGATLTRPLRREDGRLDPGRSTVELSRMIRAYDPWPGTFLETDRGRLAVWRARSTDRASGDEAGRLVAHADGIALTTADGRLVLEDVQPGGGRRMPGPAYRRGHPGIVGARAIAPD